MRDVKMYRCFIASPNDTNEERDACDEVFRKINKSIGERSQFRLESIRWEKDASASFGREPQDVINKQLFNDIDIFIGILYKSFGTPTKNYASGTEEEFYFAYEQHLDSPGTIEIKMYFNDALVKPSDVDATDLEKIKKFKDMVGALGGVYCQYNGIEDFKEKLGKDLTNYLLQHHNIEGIANFSEQSKLTISIKEVLSQRLQDALSNFEDQNVTWVDRTLCKTEDVNKKKVNDMGTEGLNKVDADNLIDNPHSMLIYAQPQFGLTCFSHYLIQSSWEKGLVWIYLDAEKASKTEYLKLIIKECHSLGVEVSDIQCIILDSWSKYVEGMSKLLRLLCNKFAETKILVMSSDITDLSQDDDEKYKRSFERYTLLQLTQNDIRGFVENYSSQFVPDGNKMLSKIVNGLTTLNLHRTPLHCLTLLKIAERNFNEQPVNRTKMVGMILTLLFDFRKAPTYSTKPDMEHCEFVLGYFCEKLIRDSNNLFTKNEFINDSLKFIKNNKISIDVYAIFDTLFKNRIIIEDESICKFRHVYWIYYFAANRMQQDVEFYNFITSNKTYASYVEIIDFFTGISRREDMLIESLTDDLKNSCDTFEEKIGLGIDFNPLDDMKWIQTKESVQLAHSKIRSEILNSNLPDKVKDEYADKNYDYNKPYKQNLPEIYEQYSLVALMGKIRACSRSLRNSEFIEPNKKTHLLYQILRSWQLISKLLFVLSPMLARINVPRIVLDGLGIVFPPEFKDKDPEEYLKIILAANPNSIVTWFQDDLYSDRISPILEEKFYSEKNTLIKHQIVMFIINNKPKSWKELIFNYIKYINKDSFYLFNTQQMLIHSYQYDFLTDKQLSETKDLIEITYVKKLTKSKYLIDAAKSVKENKSPKNQPSKNQLPIRFFKDE